VTGTLVVGGSSMAAGRIAAGDGSTCGVSIVMVTVCLSLGERPVGWT
jgi:hypothetical protein